MRHHAHDDNHRTHDTTAPPHTPFQVFPDQGHTPFQVFSTLATQHWTEREPVAAATQTHSARRSERSGNDVGTPPRIPTVALAHRTHGHSHCYSQRHAHHSLPHEQPQPGANGAPPRAPPLRHDNHNLDHRTPSQPASPPTPTTTTATRTAARVEAPAKLLDELQRRRPRPDATQLRIQHPPHPVAIHIERVFW